MKEAKWLQVTDDIYSMIGFLHGLGRVRTLRLFAVACCRRFDSYAKVRRAVQAVDVAERFADGLAPEEELRQSSEAARKAVRWTKGDGPQRALMMASEASGPLTDTGGLNGMVNCAIRDHARWKADRAQQIALLREFAGNPFRTVTLDPAWVTPTVSTIAQAAYDERSLPSGELDLARFSVLADALEDASCTDADVLSHLRSPGPHYRGCWALDSILGKA